MTNLEVLNKLQEYLKYTDEKLYLHFVEKMLENATNKKYADALNIIKRELCKKRSDLSPNEIWSSFIWTSGKIFPEDTFDLHCIFYYEVKYFIFDNLEQELHRRVVPMFNLSPNYKNSQSSSFHKHSKTYNEFLETRKIHIGELENLKGEIINGSQGI